MRRVSDIRSVIVNLDRYHTTNRPASRANENGPVTGGCPISSMVTVNIYGQHLYRELNFCIEIVLQKKIKIKFMHSGTYTRGRKSNHHICKVIQ